MSAAEMPRPDASEIAPAPRVMPPRGGWRVMADRPLAPISREFRRELLGIDDDARVVMSGHQAQWWHAGILAKWFAMEAAAGPEGGGHAAWVVVDQDDNDAEVVAYPRVGATRGRWVMGDAQEGVATGSRPVLAALSGVPGDAATRGIGDGLRTISRAMERARDGAVSLADQVRLATRETLAPLSERPARIFLATSIARTAIFARFVDAMRRDPHGCVEQYNRAVAQTPHAGVRLLRIARQSVGARVELPLWVLTPGAPRRAVFADELARLDVATLAPRALAMTALLRLAACDVFLHGLGGGAYDTITEAWLRAWLPGASPELGALPLAPTGIVTATRYVAMPTPVAIASPAALAGAVWRAHHARHTPAMLGKPEVEARKREALARIAELPRRSVARETAYRAMHAMLASARESVAPMLESLSHAARDAAASRAMAGVVYDRTWAFPLHDGATLRELRGTVRDAVSRA